VGGGRREEKKIGERREKAQLSAIRKIKGQPIQTNKPIDPFCVSNTKFFIKRGIVKRGSRHV